MRRYETVPTGEIVYQIVLPEVMREPFLRQVHGGFAGAHLGRNRTEDAMRRAYWPAWMESVDLFLKGCRPCAQYSRSKPPRQTTLQPIACGEPFETVSVDITGPHPRSYNGYSFILTVQDHFSRWTEAYPLRRHTAEAVAKALFDNWICRFGFPLNLLSDQGAEFEGTVIKQLCAAAHVDKIRTSAYNLKTNGKLERFHKTMNSMLGKCVSSNQRDWPDHVPFVLAAYRATRHESIGFTPNCVISREVRTPLDLAYRLPEESQEDVSSCEYVNRLISRLKTGYELVRDATKKTIDRMKTSYDRRVKPAERLVEGQKATLVDIAIGHPSGRVYT